MPLVHFLGIVIGVIFAAGLTLALLFWLNLPIAAFAFAALSCSLVIGARQWR